MHVFAYFIPIRSSAAERSIARVMNPYDQARGKKHPDELIPIEEWNAPNGWFN
jgi:hypothetical protein